MPITGELSSVACFYSIFSKQLIADVKALADFPKGISNAANTISETQYKISR
jgi:hypothetical protein